MCKQVNRTSTEDQSAFSPPTMSQRILGTVKANRVKCIDFGCSGVFVAVAFAVMVFAVAMFTLTMQAHGWTLKFIPLYVTLGAIGAAGVVLSIVSIKKIIEECHKRYQFYDDINEIT